MAVILSGTVLVLYCPNAAWTGSDPMPSGLGVPINLPPNLVGDPRIVGRDPRPTCVIGDVQPIGKKGGVSLG